TLRVAPRLRVDVADVAELAERATRDAGLLARLPKRRLLWRLAGGDETLRQRPGAGGPPLGPDRRQVLAPAERADEDRPRRELTPHWHSRFLVARRPVTRYTALALVRQECQGLMYQQSQEDMDE